MKYLTLLALLVTLTGCGRKDHNTGVLVSNPNELNEAISNAQPGSEIIMANGSWKNIQIRFVGHGTQDEPITLKAETPGKVLLEGQSDLKLGGEYLNVDGLYFINGYSPSRAVVQFFVNEDTLANYCRVTNCVINDFNKPQKNIQDLWILFKGRHNQLDHCYLAGKSNRGPTIRVDIEGNQSIKNYHRITHNHFGPRPPKGGPSAETIQLGNSSTSMSPSNTLVSNNLFDQCNGEVEVISTKSNFNEFRNNIFYKSEGSLVTRHGNYCIIDGNYFIGDEHSPHVGGIRLIGTGHWVTNNYFFNLKGDIFRGPLAVMNGIRRSAINRYIQVTDVVVAYNTWVNCKSPWQFGVGSNVDQRGVLPPSEIRSETPTRTVIANNVIYNSKGDNLPIVRYDSINGIVFKNNIINNQGVAFKGVEGLAPLSFSINKVKEHIWVPNSHLSDLGVYHGFEFHKISEDIFGNPRTEVNSIGAMNITHTIDSVESNIMDLSLFGPDWFNPKPYQAAPKTHAVSTSEGLVNAITNSKDGDVIELKSNQYEISSSLMIDKQLTIKSADSAEKSSIAYVGDSGTAVFEMNPKGQLTLKGVKLQGTGNNYAFASLKENMKSLYNLSVLNCEISDFDYVLKAYKHSFSELIKFQSTTIRNCTNGLELSAENDDRGEYNAENLHITDCKFENINKNVIDYYRGGYDESTVGGNLVISGSTFSNCGAEEKNGILINTHGIVNVGISDNLFQDNRIKLVARLWGAKNNSESNNIIENSGQIISEQNLTLKLMY